MTNCPTWWMQHNEQSQQDCQAPQIQEMRPPYSHHRHRRAGRLQTTVSIGLHQPAVNANDVRYQQRSGEHKTAIWSSRHARSACQNDPGEL